jgi:tetratricopeptide (TPR) repeat protein
VFAIQEEIAAQSTAEIAPKLLPATKKRQPVDVRAYSLYLQGRHYQNRRMDGFRKALECFKQAVEVDPLYAPAHAGIADVYSVVALLGVLEPAAASDAARKAATRAVELDPQSFESHAALGFVEAIFDWNPSSAAACFEKAIELEPGNADTYTSMAFCCHLPARNADRAIELTDLARNLNPFDGAIYMVRAYAEYLRGNPAAAREQYAILMGFEPDFPHMHIAMSAILHAEGKHDEALEASRRGVHLRQRSGEPDSDAVASLAYSLAMAGRNEELQRCVDELKARQSTGYVSPWCFALVYSGLRDRKRCLGEIRKMVDERSPRTIMLGFDPRFDWIREEFGDV